jgi:hypothetical protein
VTQRSNRFHYLNPLLEAGLWPAVPVISYKTINNLFSMSWKIFKNCEQPKDFAYSGRLIANKTVNLTYRLAKGMCAACPATQMIGLTKILFVN